MTSADLTTPAATASGDIPVAAQHVVTFLKPEMLHIYRQIKALRAFRPAVICQKHENAETFPIDDLHVVPKPRTHALRRLWQKQILGRPITIYRSEARRLLALLNRLRARVLHVYFGHIGVHLLPLLEISPLPVIVSFHGADAQVDHDHPAHLSALRQVFQRATLLLVRSESIAARLIAAGAEASKIRVHRTGMPLAEIPFAQRTPPADDAWHCVQASRLIPKKGLATSLRAFAEFQRTYPRSTFTIAGEGPLKEELLSLAASLGIADRLSFPGFLSQAKLRELYATSHFFVHPSELGPDGDQEGVPNAMLEAMATGLPVVATTHGGIPEAVEHGISGLLTPERDHAALAQSLFSLAGDPVRYTAFSATAAARVQSAFDLAAQARILEGYYREAIDLRAGKPVL